MMEADQVMLYYDSWVKEDEQKCMEDDLQVEEDYLQVVQDDPYIYYVIHSNFT